MNATQSWLGASGAEFLPGQGISGCAHLTHYTVDYREWGQGPPLVLVPGLAGGFDLLGPIAKILAENFRVISYQLRGEDNCFTLRRPFSLSDLVQDLHEFIDSLYLENPTVFGVSFGGLVALQYATQYTSRLDKLIVQGAGSKYEAGLMQRVAKTVLSRFPLPADNPFINQFFNLLFGCPQKKDALFNFVTRQCWQTDQSMMAYRLRLVETFNIEDRLGKIRVPTLILAGDRDVLVSKRNLQKLANGIGRHQLEIIPGAGHLAFVTQPRLMAEKVLRFYRQAQHEIPV